jgi:AraC-like DNA-binding protein
MQFKKTGKKTIQVFRYSGYDRVKKRSKIEFIGSLHTRPEAPYPDIYAGSKLLRNVTPEEKKEVDAYIEKYLREEEHSRLLKNIDCLPSILINGSKMLKNLSWEEKQSMDPDWLQVTRFGIEQFSEVLKTLSSSMAQKTDTVSQDTEYDNTKNIDSAPMSDNNTISVNVPTINNDSIQTKEQNEELVIIYLGKNNKKFEMTKLLYEKNLSEAKRLFIEDGKNVREISKELKLPSTLITKWKKEEHWEVEKINPDVIEDDSVTPGFF